MVKQTTIPPSARDIHANVLQLCDYIEDMRNEPDLKLFRTFDYEVLRAKAQQVHKLITEQ